MHRLPKPNLLSVGDQARSRKRSSSLKDDAVSKEPGRKWVGESGTSRTRQRALGIQIQAGMCGTRFGAKTHPRHSRGCQVRVRAGSHHRIGRGSRIRGYPRTLRRQERGSGFGVARKSGSGASERRIRGETRSGTGRMDETSDRPRTMQVHFIEMPEATASGISI